MKVAAIAIGCALVMAMLAVAIHEHEQPRVDAWNAFMHRCVVEQDNSAHRCRELYHYGAR